MKGKRPNNFKVIDASPFSGPKVAATIFAHFVVEMDQK